MLNRIEGQKTKQVLVQGFRTDGRRLDESRATKVIFSRSVREYNPDDPYGCLSRCEVAFGDSNAIAFVHVEAVTPFPDKPNEGFLSVMSHFNPMASESFDSNSKSSSLARISSLIELAVKDSGAIDLEALCISSGQRAWKVYCNVHVINHDGNLADLCSLAAIGALSHFRKPEVDFIAGNESTGMDIIPLEEREPVPLSIIHWPICVTFGLLYLEDIEVHPNKADEENIDVAESVTLSKTIVIADPSEKEGLMLDGFVCVVVNEHGEFCAIEKEGWPPISQSCLNKCSEQAVNIAKKRLALLLNQ